MALQKKRYRNGQPRGGVATKRMAGPRNPKDYGRSVRSFHGSKTDEVQEKLHQQIIRKKTYG